MPSVILNNMKTTWVDDDPWSSPDGKVTIWSIKLQDKTGERSMYSTMSKNIATIGWSGDIELYTNAKGKEYVRQAPKDEPAVAGGSSWGSDSPEKQDSIYRSVALNNAVTLHAAMTQGKDAFSSVNNAVLKTANDFLNWLKKEEIEQDEEIKSDEDYQVDAWGN